MPVPAPIPKTSAAKIYGAKIIENVTQALARQIFGNQIYQIHFKYKVALCVHDSVVCIVPVKDKDEATEFIRMAMKKVPDWAKGLPVDCEVKVGENYGEFYAA